MPARNSPDGPAVDSTGCRIFEPGPSYDKRSGGIRGRTSEEDKTYISP